MNKNVIKIDKISLGKKAADVIRDRIIEGVYSQGSRIVEEELSNEFEISRVCVRDALLILESEGMVVRHANKYTKVIELDKKSVMDLFIFRKALETLSIEQCILNDTVPRHKLIDSINKLSNLDNNKNISWRRYVEEDLKFHEHIVLSSGNSYVISDWKRIKYQMLTLLFDIYANQTFNFEGLTQHKELLEYLIKNEIDKAQKVLVEHIQDNLDFIISHK